MDKLQHVRLHGFWYDNLLSLKDNNGKQFGLRKCNKVSKELELWICSLISHLQSGALVAVLVNQQ